MPFAARGQITWFGTAHTKSGVPEGKHFVPYITQGLVVEIGRGRERNHCVIP